MITARGGSKEIPKKNIINVCGYPLIWYVINASKNSRVNETWVSTDDELIKQISKKYDCNVIDRPSKMATDSSKSEEALIHFAKNNIFDIIVFIQPTSPLLTSIDIDGGLNLISKYNSVFSAYKEHWFPRWSNEEDPQPIGWQINMRPMRQEKEYNFVENGAFYITTRDCLLSSGLRYSGKIGIYEMPFSRSIQLDNNDDIRVIQSLLKNR